MEAAMYRTAIAGTLALLATALLVSGRAEAGGSASAASKYTNGTKQVAAINPVRQARSADFRITEYSSSSVRTHAAKNR
jgi:hypothetical protein